MDFIWIFICNYHKHFHIYTYIYSIHTYLCTHLIYSIYSTLYISAMCLYTYVLYIVRVYAVVLHVLYSTVVRVSFFLTVQYRESEGEGEFESVGEGEGEGECEVRVMRG